VHLNNEIAAPLSDSKTSGASPIAAKRLLGLSPIRLNYVFEVMPALVAGIHVFLAVPQQTRRGWPGQARPRLLRKTWST
jgi:hypothetical protein